MSSSASTATSSKEEENKMTKKPRLTAITLAPTNKAHCFFCDTRIAQGTPRVHAHLYHAATGAYVRNNGAAYGHNAGGWMDMYAHPQCCFQYRTLTTSPKHKKQTSTTCLDCDQLITDGRRVLTVVQRCHPSNRPPFVQCFACAVAFLQRHRDVWQGYLSAAQRQQAVAWAPPISPFVPTADATWHLPKQQTLRTEYLALFADSDNDDTCIQRHVALQDIIRTALATDRKLGGKLTPNKTGNHKRKRGK